jgi:hypothetical protein
MNDEAARQGRPATTSYQLPESVAEGRKLDIRVELQPAMSAQDAWRVAFELLEKTREVAPAGCRVRYFAFRRPRERSASEGEAA